MAKARKPNTATVIRESIAAAMEPNQPADAILEYLKAHEGKLLTARDLPALKAINPTIEIRKMYGMTQIEWGAYSQQHGRSGGSMTIAHTEKAPTIECARIEASNICYFSARVERNASRAKSLAHPTAIDRAAAAVDAIRDAQAVLAELTEYGEILGESRYMIAAMVDPKAAK